MIHPVFKEILNEFERDSMGGNMDALEGSIKKWKRIVRSTKALEKGIQNCPLCREYYHGFCDRCPVKVETSRLGCEGTPYDAWITHQGEVHSNSDDISKHREPHCKECFSLAKEELAFLESLREK